MTYWSFYKRNHIKVKRIERKRHLFDENNCEGVRKKILSERLTGGVEERLRNDERYLKK